MNTNKLLIILFAISLLLNGVVIYMLQNTNHNNNLISQNIAALNDSVRVSNENNRTVYSRYNLNVQNMNELKDLMPELFTEIEGLRNQRSITNVSHFHSYYNNTINEIPTTSTQLNDSTYVLNWDYVSQDSSRLLSGNTTVNTNLLYVNDSTNRILINPLYTNITRDQLRLDFTVGLRRGDNNLEEIFVIPSNPNVTIGEIQGASVVRKNKRWIVGPYGGVGVGYNPISSTITPQIQVGFGVGFGVIKF